jgi:TetR/AcrR family transcriptional regulator
VSFKDHDRDATRARILDAAIARFGTKGYEATSLDSIASDVGLAKQTILYWFGSKEGLLEAALDLTASELTEALEAPLRVTGEGWAKVESLVRSVFRLAGRRPELLGLVREATRIGPPASTRLSDTLGPLLERAVGFLQEEMDAGRMRKQDPRLVLLAAYSTVVGMATEVQILAVLGEEPGPRSLVRRRRELLCFLSSALLVEGEKGS